MSKKLTIHFNEYDRLKGNKQRKPKWLTNEIDTFYHTFEKKETKKKNVRIAEKKLAQVGLSFDILNEKYSGVTDSLLHICDAFGNTLWMNNVLLDTYYQGNEDEILQPHLLYLMDWNPQNLKLKQQLKGLIEDYPKTLELVDALKTSGDDFYIKVLYERIDGPDGKPFGYFSTSKVFPIYHKVEPLQKKQKTKQEIIEEKLRDSGIKIEMFQKYDQEKCQIIVIDLLGRVLWMNEMFKDVNLKFDQSDILEGLNGQYGFEAFDELCDIVLKELPSKFEDNNIEFQKIIAKDQSTFGYLVIFKTLVQVKKNSNPKELSEKFLSRVGYSFEMLDNMYGKSSPFVLVSFSGRVLWMNPMYEAFSKRSMERDLMDPAVYIMFQTNPENTFLKENITRFVLERSEEVKFSSDLKLTYGGTQLINIEGKRINSPEGIPLMYSVDLRVYMK